MEIWLRRVRVRGVVKSRRTRPTNDIPLMRTLPLVAIVLGLLSASAGDCRAVEPDTPPVYFEQKVAQSNSLHVEQAKELDAYINAQKGRSDSAEGSIHAGLLVAQGLRGFYLPAQTSVL